MCFGWYVLALSVRKRIFLKNKKADHKQCENWRRESSSEFHKTSPTCEWGEWRKELQDFSAQSLKQTPLGSCAILRLFWPNGGMVRNNIRSHQKVAVGVLQFRWCKITPLSQECSLYNPPFEWTAPPHSPRKTMWQCKPKPDWCGQVAGKPSLTLPRQFVPDPTLGQLRFSRISTAISAHPHSPHRAHTFLRISRNPGPGK